MECFAIDDEGEHIVAAAKVLGPVGVVGAAVVGIGLAIAVGIVADIVLVVWLLDETDADFAKFGREDIGAVATAVHPASHGIFGSSVAGGDIFAGVIPVGVAGGFHSIPGERAGIEVAVVEEIANGHVAAVGVGGVVEGRDSFKGGQTAVGPAFDVDQFEDTLAKRGVGA